LPRNQGYDRSSVCVSSYFFAFIREFNILCFDSILNGGYVLFKASNIKDFVTLPRNQGYKNKYTGEIWKKSNTNYSPSSFIFPIHIY
jgi:hypothetical protein